MDAVDTEREVRAAQNQSLFREVNERLKAIAETFEFVAKKTTFACECADTACIDQISMRIDEYEAVRADPTHFVVKPGHVFLDVEDVVSNHEAYVVVAKQRAGAEVAKSVDPRGGAMR